MHNKQKGIIQLIILIIIALVILKYGFNISFNDIIHSQVVQELWSIVKQIFSLLWQVIMLCIGYIQSFLPKAQQYLNTLKTK